MLALLLDKTSIYADSHSIRHPASYDLAKSGKQRSMGDAAIPKSQLESLPNCHLCHEKNYRKARSVASRRSL